MQLEPCSDADRFDAFVAESPYGHIHQSFAWGEVKSHFGWKPLRFVAQRNGRIVAAVSLLRTTRHGIPILYASRGPVLDYGDPDALSRVLLQLKEIARRERALFLRISPAVPRTDAAVMHDLAKHGFSRTSKPLQHTSSIRLDLAGRSADDVLKSFNGSTRYNVRAATKRGLRVRRVETEDEVDAFRAILGKTAERKGIEFLDLEYYRTVYRILAPRGMARVYLAYVDDAVAAGVFVLSFGGTAWYMYGGFDYAYKKYFPSYGLQWAAIEDCLATGIRAYDFQGIPEQSESLPPGAPERGLYEFKAGFGGEIVRWFGEWDVSGLPWPLYAAANRLKVV